MSSDLQNKLFHFEADPPKEAWNKIAGTLDADIEQTFPQRLYHFEEQPSANIWDKIEASLAVEPAIKVIPITRFKKPLRYMAAAASILIAVVLTVNLLDQKTGSGSVIGGTQTVNTTNESSVLPLNNPVVSNKVDPSSKRTTNALSGTLQGNDREEPVKRRTLISIRPQNIFPSFTLRKGFIPKKVNKEVLFDFSDMENYMVYSDGKGNAMRVSKKLFSLVSCDDGDYSCYDRIRQLQQKMATNATTTDFGGVLEILRQLQ